MMKSDLRLCPFCGGNTVLVPHSICSGTVECIGKCGFKSAKFWDNMLNHEPQEKWSDKATKAWNRRVGDGK